VKFSFRQILASTGGAVIAAIVASTFGVKGTIIGVAIGSAAATMGTALVAQSIERGHEAVKQVVVKAPETATLLRKLGGTGLSGDTTTSSYASSAPTEVVRPVPPDDRRVEMASTAAPVGETMDISAVADAPATERLQATTRPMRPAVRRPAMTWRGIAAAALIVFVLALLFITAIELISGKPLSAIFGGSDVGTSVKNLFSPGPTPATTTTSTTTVSTTSSTTSTSTTTTTSATTTSTTGPAGDATTTTSPAPANTTTTVVTGGAPTTSSAP
jgi:hypothetical protein